MAKYTISSDYGSVFGMDVHARSITVKGFNWPTGEERTRTFADCLNLNLNLPGFVDISIS